MLAIITLILLSWIVFAASQLLPGDLARNILGNLASTRDVERMNHELGVDRPIYEQYWLFIKGIVLHFDFGYSYTNSQEVRTEMLERLPATASLTIGAVVVWLLIGLPVGVISAVRSRSLVDRFAMGATLLAISAPVYWLGLMGLFFFSEDIGRVANIFPGAGSYVPFSQDPAQWFGSLLLPWLVLAASFAAFYARLLRSNLIDTMSQDYIRTARAKGLSERAVIWRHAVRAAITPIITILGLDIGILLGGSILTETVFNIPGIGRYAYEGIINSDLPVIQGTVLFGAFFIVMANLVVDIVYALLDPRVRYS